jgi:predicted phosphodiesterase
MRIAAISDTHGDLNLINTIVRESNADAVIHAGDFGFYDDESVSRLSDRELSLHILHSKLSDPQKQLALGLGRDEKETFIREHAPLSQLPAFLAGTEAFDVPVYVVWGNHEDIEVVRKFCSAQYRVRNLNMLHENSSFHLNNLHLFGLGGKHRDRC